MDDLLRIAIHDNLTLENEEDLVNDRVRHTWMELAGAQVGRLRHQPGGLHRPLPQLPQSAGGGAGAAARNSNAYGDNACGVLQTDLTCSRAKAASC